MRTHSVCAAIRRARYEPIPGGAASGCGVPVRRPLPALRWQISMFVPWRPRRPPGEHERTAQQSRTDCLQLPRGAPVHPDDAGLGCARHGPRRIHRRSAGVAAAELRPALDQLRPAATDSHQSGDLRLRWRRAVRLVLLHRSAHQPCPADLRSAGGAGFLGLAGSLRGNADQLRAGLHHVQGIRRDGVADRTLGDADLGALRLSVLRHHRPPAHPAHLCRQLVLRRLHHRHRHGAHHQPRAGAGRAAQVLLAVFGRHRCDGAVVVRAQRGGLHPLGRLSRDDVLLRAQTGGAADLLVPSVHRAFLGDHLDLHLGRPASSALHRAAGLGAEPGHGDVDHPAGAELGRHDQRHDDPFRCLA